jgi:glycosyltransferase involved in cell wall biosynthesis
VKRPLSKAGDVLRIAYIGQIAPHKGVHLLIDAFRRIEPRFQLIELHIHGGLDGHPPYVAQLKKIAGNDQRIHFHGRFSNHSVIDILQWNDVLVVPSNWFEIGPLTISEAQAAGTPVVASAIGNIVDLVHDGVDGLLFQVGDSTDLQRQLQRLIDEQELLPYLRANIERPRSVADEMAQLAMIYSSITIRSF